jgi:hypothetical protein
MTYSRDDSETTLWIWLLFHAGIKTFQAKQLLSSLSVQDMTLSTFIRTPSEKRLSLGFDEEHALISQPAGASVYPPAIRWNEELYPQGLHDLPLKIKPAVIFYQGTSDLLSRPIIYLEPGEIPDNNLELVTGMVELLLDSEWLPAVFVGSPQETILIDLMTHNAGEVLIFLDRGVEQWRPVDKVAHFMHQGRILVLSPLPSHTPATPALTIILRQIASAAACRWVASSGVTLENRQAEINRPALQLHANGSPEGIALRGVKIAVNIPDAIAWLVVSRQSLQNPALTPEGNLTVSPELPDNDNLEPISADNALEILESGGNVPDILRQRLMEKHKSNG